MNFDSFIRETPDIGFGFAEKGSHRVAFEVHAVTKWISSSICFL